MAQRVVARFHTMHPAFVLLLPLVAGHKHEASHGAMDILGHLAEANLVVASKVPSLHIPPISPGDAGDAAAEAAQALRQKQQELEARAKEELEVQKAKFNEELKAAYQKMSEENEALVKKLQEEKQAELNDHLCRIRGQCSVHG